MPPSRPTTPVDKRRRRHSHRSSGVRLPTLSPRIHHYPVDKDQLPLESDEIINKFKNIRKSMEVLDINMRDLSHIHHAISDQFNESFGSFLYGLSMTLWCVDFPGHPSKEAFEESIKRKEKQERINQLKKRIEEAESINARLKRRLSEEKVNEARRIPVTRPLSKQYSNLSNKRIKSAHQNGNSSLNSENSFVTQPKPRIPPHHKSTSQSTKDSPNLNQPPRYMKGVSNFANQRPKKPSNLANRPPFR